MRRLLLQKLHQHLLLVLLARQLQVKKHHNQLAIVQHKAAKTVLLKEHKVLTVQRKAAKTALLKEHKVAIVQHRVDKVAQVKEQRQLATVQRKEHQHKLIIAQHNKADKAVQQAAVVQVVQAEAAVAVGVHQRVVLTKDVEDIVRLHNRKWNCHYQKK